jgi:hypothetical protein
MRVGLATASANKTPTGLPFQDVTLAKESVETENAVEALDQGKVLFLRWGMSSPTFRGTTPLKLASVKSCRGAVLYQ